MLALKNEGLIPDGAPPGWLAAGRRRGGAAAGRLSLALQGGGAYGAYTWGVLDRLLEAEEITFDAVSGASAGAVNAVLLASGLAEGGRAAARHRLAQFWTRLSELARFVPGAAAAGDFLVQQHVSPYQFNPLGLNPLRGLLLETVDFERLRAAAPLRLLVAATRVRDGLPHYFREGEMTIEAVLASASLPFLNHAVEVAGEWYWDGGYSANPPLRPLIRASQTSEVLLVQILPQAEEGVPHGSREIARRIGQIVFNTPLQKEIEALEEMRALCRGAGLFSPRRCRKLRRLRLHRLSAVPLLETLPDASAFNLDQRYLGALRDGGRAAAAAWLAS